LNVESKGGRQTCQVGFSVVILLGKKSMHRVVKDSLEDYLAGTLEPVETHPIEAHLATCAGCREELQSMEDVSLLFGSFRLAPAHDSENNELAPSPGFYARVMERVAQSQAAPSWNNFFGFNPTWGRRLAFSCLLVLAAMGTFLISSERGYVSGPMPDAVMAEQNQAAFDSAPASESMLVTLANYEH
jgi:anti-sigma factor RsiW